MTFEDENIQMVNWRKYSDSDNLVSEYALPANSGKWITKGVIYLKNKKSLKLEQFRKTYSRKTLKIAALNITSFLSYFRNKTCLQNYN